jgi:hypothetical protein
VDDRPSDPPRGATRDGACHPPIPHVPRRRSVSAGTLLAWLTSDVFPADRDLLVAAALACRVPSQLTDELRRLPEGAVFQDVEQLASSLDAQRWTHIPADEEVRQTC